MLIRNCENADIEKLLKNGDFNIRVTPWFYSKRYTQLSTWKEIIRDVLGGGIVHSSDSFSVELTCISDIEHPIKFNCRGSEIAEVIVSKTTVESIRIKIIGPKKNRSWIIYPIPKVN